MAIAWSPWSYGSPSNGLQVGIDLSVSGTTVNWAYYANTQYDFSDSQTLERWGQVAGSVAFYNDGGLTLIASGSFTGTRGVTYGFGARLTGAYNGASPEVVAYVTVPAAPPSTPSTPTVGSITASGCSVSWSAPASNGATITAYQVQVDDSAAFGSPAYDASGGGSPRAVSGLTRATTYYARVRAQNSAGWSGWSAARSFTTLPVAPAAPGAPAVSNVTPDGLTASWVAPGDDGGATITNYTVRVATDAGSTNVVQSVTTTALSKALAGLTPGTDYWVSVRAYNSAGWGPYSAAAPTTTLSPVYYGEAGGYTQVRGYYGEGGAWRPVRIMAPDGASWEG